MIVLSVVVVAVLLFFVLRTQQEYSKLREETDILLSCQSAAPDLNRGSDYLTAQVRSFAITGQREYCDRYFHEAKVTKRRDKAIEALEPYLQNSEALAYLNTAMENSLELMEIEYYSMALVWNVEGYPIEEAPPEIQSVVLSPEDLALSKEEQKDKAAMMLFDDTYQGYKQRIDDNVTMCLNQLMSSMRIEQAESYNGLSKILIILFIMILLLLLAVLAVVFLTIHLVMRPMLKATDYIRNQQVLPVKGAAEVQFLAEAYNDAFEKTQKKQEDLQRTALHDALTGLLNRAAYDQVANEMEDEQFYLLLIDVDNFKTINDTYGHDVGDLILKSTADVLRRYFRSDDLIFRFGGDEFVVIMMNARKEMKDLIRIKIGNANRKLTSDENLPPVTISVGAVFVEGALSEEAFKEADKSLYEVKKHKRGDISFGEMKEKD